MQYFLDGLANEYERVVGEISRLGTIGRTATGQTIQLTESQQQGLTDLKLRNVTEFNRREYEQAAGVGRGLATADLNVLAEAGVLDRVGDGPRRRYRFPRSAANPWMGRGGGRPREWTDERIERELRALIGESTIFPSVAEFRAASQMKLYQAIGRHGGSKEWSQRLRVSPPRAG
jgi:hypothetical protein